jgi:hypothetical protein
VWWPSWTSTLIHVEPIGLILGPHYVPSGPSRALLGSLGPLWGSPGAIMGSPDAPSCHSCDHLGVRWPPFGRTWAPLGSTWLHIAHFGIQWLHVDFPILNQCWYDFWTIWMRNRIKCISPTQFDSMCLQNPPYCINHDKRRPFNLATLHPWTFILGTGLVEFPKGWQ